MLITIAQIWMKSNVKMYWKCSTHHYSTCIWNTNKWHTPQGNVFYHEIFHWIVILQNSNINEALHDKMVCWLSHCSDYNALQHLPNCEKRSTLSKRYLMHKLYLEKQECIIPSIGLLSTYLCIHSLMVVSHYWHQLSQQPPVSCFLWIAQTHVMYQKKS